MAENKRDILGNSVETLRDPLKADHAPQDYRGNVSLVDTPLPPEKYDSVEEICAPRAIKIAKEMIMLDMGKCILCGRCEEATPDLFKVGSEYAPPAKTRKDLVESLSDMVDKSYEAVGKDLKEMIDRVFGRSLAIREVDAGSCNGCEVEITALSNPIYDIERFGIHFVASPRHADVLLVTGPASRNMEVALKRTYEATPDPKIVVAVGACGCSSGIFGHTCATTGGIDNVVPVDVYIPGCPPRPEALLHGLLMAVDRIGKTAQ